VGDVVLCSLYCKKNVINILGELIMENDKNVKKGEYHEKNFAELLNNYGIPFLFIEQGPQDEHHSIALKGSEIKRPDFLIYLQTIGHIFIDVKSRYKIENIEDINVSQFYLKDDEINSLFSLQSYLFLPLWIAFVSTKKGDDNNFYLVPISVLKNYKDQLKNELGENNYIFDHLFIRIPNSFLKKMDINDLMLINNLYDFNNIKNEAEIYKRLEEKIKDIIIDKKEINTQDYCKNENINYLKVMEIDSYIKSNSK
jgi:hypothetical protein